MLSKIQIVKMRFNTLNMALGVLHLIQSLICLKLQLIDLFNFYKSTIIGLVVADKGETTSNSAKLLGILDLVLLQQ